MNNQELIKKIKRLKELEVAGQPRASWVLSNKELLMSQIQRGSQEASPASFKNQVFYNIGELARDLFGQRFLRPVAAVALAFVLFFSYSATVNFADSSLPGDTFYPLKTAGEKMQLAFTFQEDKKLQLQIDFVVRRTEELQLLVTRDQTSEVKAERITQAVKKISADVQSVKERLNKITTAGTSAELINMAKQVDFKTAAIQKDIEEVSGLLSEEVKERVAEGVSQAIVSTEAVSRLTLSVLVEKYKKGNGEVTNEEMAVLIAERIKKAEIKVEEVSLQLQIAASSTIALINGNTSIAATSTLALIQNLNDDLTEAKVLVEKAKDLLDQKEFVSAAEKIQASRATLDKIIQELSVLLSIKSGNQEIVDSGLNQFLGTSTGESISGSVNNASVNE